ncbi:MAG: hypothetical protein ACREV6_22130 [Clostridium sp.]|uniref:hypothetical protein n=1 Tax=Clostridium sp. TaxID=1506 RepID=UPI003D6D4CD2
MNRKDRRSQPKELQKANKDINSLTPMQARVVDLVAMERADIIVNKYIQNFEKLFDRNMSAALIDYGIDYNDISDIQTNMSRMLLEDSRKSEKLEEGNFNMTEIESKVLAEVKDLLDKEVSKKESIELLRDKFPRLSRSMLVNAYVKVKREMGLTENRISKEVVYAEFDRCAVRLSGPDMVTNIINKFGFTETTAKTYYSKWKNYYMMGKIEIDPIAPADAPVIKNAAAPTTLSTLKTHVPAIKQLEENAKKIIEAAKERQCLEPLVIKEVEVIKVKGLKVIESKVVVRKTIKVEGSNGMYDADTEKGVTLSREDMSISFSNEEQLDEWVSEVKAVLNMVI